ncbi:TrbI/VirB10 family protein [Massilia sp. erpn]|uniref:TrbI/VirB10 family protein n=1 Tax=Massilia sp. erpn TaxID=2738142 RepID=UPI0021071BC2|nr:TrbI/VirB10 family protein [Massilia sp. erpn]UTY55865.1 TrbI/VirB10 family protein [Massilia sp. erpn]
MAKDPFQELPKLEPEGEHGHAPDLRRAAAENANDIAASAPPRNLLKSLTKWTVPIFFGGTLIWLFVSPDKPRGRLEAQKVEVDTRQQTIETESMLKSMKSAAEKSQPVVLPLMPGSPPASAAAASGPLPPGFGHAQRAPGPPAAAYAAAAPMPSAMPDEAMADVQKRAAEQQKRMEDIRAAPMEAGQVRLLAQGGPAEVAKLPGVVADLQADIAGERAAVARSQQAMQEQMLAALAPKEAPKSKGANQDFLASAAASAGARTPVAAMQNAAGRYLVGEGAVIRAVLLTNVNSDLPGRILARISSDVYDSSQKHVLIPKGSLLNGVYNSQIIIGQERLLMAMTRLTLPNGNWIPLAGVAATDMMGTSGMDAEVNNHFMKMFSSSLIIGASTLMLPRADTSVTTLPGTTGASGAATAGSVFATTLNDVLKTLMERNKNIAPTLQLGAGQEFIFMANQDMLLLPYR